MTARRLGTSDLSFEPLVLGGNVFGWTADEPTSFAVLDRFVEAGFSAIDTADSYQTWVPGHKGGESETVIGNWLKSRGNRDKVLVMTKVGADMGEAGSGLSAAHIERSVEASLKRLQTDYIDLYQSHYEDLSVPPEETLGAYDRLIKAGKVRAIGASNTTPANLQRDIDVARRKSLPVYASLQPLYNLYDRTPFETDYLPVVEKEKLGVIPYFSLAAGFLTGKYHGEADLSKSPRGGGMKKYLNPRGLRILDALDAVAGRNDATLAEIALAWLLAKPGVTAPIASATSTEQLDSLIKGVRLELALEDIVELDKASAP